MVLVQYGIFHVFVGLRNVNEHWTGLNAETGRNEALAELLNDHRLATSSRSQSGGHKHYMVLYNSI